VTPTRLVVRAGPCDAESASTQKDDHDALASTLRNRHGSAWLDAQKGYAGTPTIRNALSLLFPFHSPAAMGGVSVWRRASTAVQGRSELQPHDATVLQCLAVEVREGLGRHTSSAFFLGTPQNSGRSPCVVPRRRFLPSVSKLSGDLLDHELPSAERDRWRLPSNSA
jgi:hypothetical protein